MYITLHITAQYYHSHRQHRKARQEGGRAPRRPRPPQGRTKARHSSDRVWREQPTQPDASTTSRNRGKAPPAQHDEHNPGKRRTRAQHRQRSPSGSHLKLVWFMSLFSYHCFDYTKGTPRRRRRPAVTKATAEPHQSPTQQRRGLTREAHTTRRDQTTLLFRLHLP